MAQLLAPFGIVSDGDQAAFAHLAAFGVTEPLARRFWCDDRDATQTVLTYYHYLLQRGPNGQPPWPNNWNNYLRSAITKRYRFEQASFLAWRAQLEARATDGTVGEEVGSLSLYPAFARPELSGPTDGVLVRHEVPASGSSDAGGGETLGTKIDEPPTFAELVAKEVRADPLAPRGLSTALLWPRETLVHLSATTVRLTSHERLIPFLAPTNWTGEGNGRDVLCRAVASVLQVSAADVIVDVVSATMLTPHVVGRD